MGDFEVTLKKLTSLLRESKWVKISFNRARKAGEDMSVSCVVAIWVKSNWCRG